MTLHPMAAQLLASMRPQLVALPNYPPGWFARKLTRENPAAVANIVKTWMNGEAPA